MIGQCNFVKHTLNPNMQLIKELFFLLEKVTLSSLSFTEPFIIIYQNDKSFVKKFDVIIVYR